MKVYTVIRLYREHEIGNDRARGSVVVRVDGRLLPLRLDLANHSPTGFEFGYGGSGPAQLSLALLADALGDDDEALNWYQYFKEKVVAHMDGEEWSMTDEQVREHVESLRERHPDRAKEFEEGRPFRLWDRHIRGCATCKKAENGEAPDWCPEGKRLFEACEKIG